MASVINKLTPEEHARRLELWKQGLTDAEMAKAIGCYESTIYYWRKRNGLAPNRAKDERRMKLWRQGLTDREIAEALGEKINTIAMWRNRNGLSPNKGARKQGNDDKRRMELWEKGLTDAEIAEIVGKKRGAIRQWRHVRNLPANSKREQQKQKRQLDQGIHYTRVIPPEKQHIIRKFLSDLAYCAKEAKVRGQRINVGAFLETWVKLDRTA